MTASRVGTCIALEEFREDFCINEKDLKSSMAVKVLLPDFQ